MRPNDNRPMPVRPHLEPLSATGMEQSVGSAVQVREGDKKEDEEEVIVLEQEEG